MVSVGILLAVALSQSLERPRIVSPNKFVVTYWWSPPPEETTPERYREIATAGFNLVMPGAVDLPVDKARAHNLRVLDLCKANGLKAVILDSRVTDAKPSSPNFGRDLDAVVKDFARHPALYGYFVADEPSDRDFPRLAAICEGLRKRDPKHVAYINLVPVVAGGMFGGPPFRNDPKDYPAERDAYTKHVENYIAQVKPTLVSYDEYDLFVGGGIRGMYFANLELIRRLAGEHRIPFWNIVLVTPHVHPHGTYRDPSLDDLRFLMYTTLAYGARGMCYFTYFTPPGGFGDAIIGKDGKPTRHYNEVRSLNFELYRLAPTLCKLKSDGVYHVGKLPLECQPLPSDTILTKVDGSDVVVSFLSDSGRGRYLMIVNKDMTQSQRIGIQFANDYSLRELSAVDGKWRSVPGLRDFSSDYLPGQGKLFSYNSKR